MVILNQIRKGAFQCALGADRVVAGVAVPRGGSVLQVQGHIDVMTPVRIAIDEIVNYTLRSYFIPVPDFDTPDTYGDIWDRFVPKDESGTDTIDVDELAVDTDVTDVMGEPDLESIMGIRGTKLKKVYKNSQEMSYASHPMFPHLDTTNFYWPAQRHSIKMNRKVSAEEPGVLLYAVSSPSTTATATGLHSTPPIDEWARMSVLDYTLDQMMMNFIGATEAGATVTYAGAQALLVKLMEPPVIEESAVAGHYLGTILNIGASLNFKVKYPMKTVRGEISSVP